MKNRLKFFQAPAIMLIVILFAFTGIYGCGSGTETIDGDTFIIDYNGEFSVED